MKFEEIATYKTIEHAMPSSNLSLLDGWKGDLILTYKRRILTRTRVFEMLFEQYQEGNRDRIVFHQEIAEDIEHVIAAFSEATAEGEDCIEFWPLEYYKVIKYNEEVKKEWLRTHDDKGRSD